MRLIDDRTGLEVIDRRECLDLLRAQTVGRIGIVAGDEPVILPINYVMDGEAVVFRTATGSKFHAMVSGSAVAVEIDAADPLSHTGWSVLLMGRATEIVEEAEKERLDREAHLRPWARGEKSHYMRVEPRRITGRRIVRVV